MLRPGDRVPDFSAPDQTGAVRHGGEFRENWLLLYFYPHDNTPGCTTQACSLRDHYASLKRYVNVVGVSNDSVRTHAAFASQHELPFTLLSDRDRAITRAFGVGGGFYAKRTSFLVDPDGIIVKVYERVKPRRHPEELLADFTELIDAIALRA
jgi:thioredoxin-dependent peroxiredoxin